ncbi:hypothetical protein Poli38472_001052 [Pythium oligandrum]|uniref:Serine protease n=1 Tax=Pythium oligandrum TaxID=41045 RepID=A0A8K1FN15_PYTOL|nr:hypothetical protein Poli38472_001052 [Pythium oligandrum]|eukprot:TMW68896.1 hypothetical protein Poli38472_001052 [Pythium oligandrum]
MSYEDPQLEVASRSFGDGSPDGNQSGSLDDQVHRMRIFPRHQVPQVRLIREPRALFIAVNIREVALLPGDRLILRDGSNDTEITITRQNQSIAKRVQHRRVLWNHPFLMTGDKVVVEYWPSLTTLVLPINRKQLDNAVAVIDSYTFAYDARGRRRRGSDDDYDRLGITQVPQAESIVGSKNEMKPAVCFKKSEPRMYCRARAVARLLIRNEGDQQWHHHAMMNPSSRWTYCTGWLVGRENHMMTNYHCVRALMRRSGRVFPFIQNQGTASNDAGGGNDTDTSVNFMAESSTCGDVGYMGERVGVVEATRAKIVAMSEALDYSLLQLEPNNTSVDLSSKYGYLTLRASGPVDGEAIYIPQHPNGEPKMIAAISDGQPAFIRVLPIANSTSSSGSGSMEQQSNDSDGSGSLSDATYDNVSVWYNADTAPGSSGSPVLSQRDHTVVALHHAGGAIVTSSDPTANQQAMNIGIRIDAIGRDLQQRRVLPPCAFARDCRAKTKDPCCSNTKSK